MATPSRETSPSLLEALVVSTVLAIALQAIPAWAANRFFVGWLVARSWTAHFSDVVDGLSLLLALALCVGARQRSGLVLGRWRNQTAKVIGLCLVPVVLTAVIYPLTERPFAGSRMGVWLLSPAAQELLFSGYVFGLLRQASPGPLHPKLVLDRAGWLTALLFALWHLPNLQALGLSYTAFQLVYTFAGMAWTLLARQWTGSVIAGIATHTLINLIAWWP